MAITITSLTINKTATPVSIDIFKAFEVEVTLDTVATRGVVLVNGIAYPLKYRGDYKWGTYRRIPCMHIGADTNAYDIEVFVGDSYLVSAYKIYSDVLTITANAGSRYITDKYNKVMERFLELAQGPEGAEYFEEINGWAPGYSLSGLTKDDVPIFHIPHVHNAIKPRSMGSRKSGTVHNQIVLDIVIYDQAITGDYTRINRLAERIETFFNKNRSLDSFYGIRIAKVTDIDINFNADSLAGGSMYELEVSVFIDLPSIRGYI